MRKSVLFYFVIVSLIGCNNSDNVVDLGDGYFYRNEGGMIKDILSEISENGEIPSTVLDYSYDNNFIIAKQKPKIPQDPLYSKKINYKLGLNREYYWVIQKKQSIVIGPLSFDEYRDIFRLKKIPKKLYLN